MKKSTMGAVAAVVGAVTLLGAFGAYAGVFSGNGEKRAFRFISYKIDAALDEINATDAQRQQVNGLKDDLFEQGKQLKNGMEGAREQLKAQWAAPQVDGAKVHSVIDERIDAIRAFAHKAADAMIKVHDILTPEQRNQLAQMRERARERFQERW